tara:strand:- start:81 stop:857 length:777 start_codon:yes stop_codon:yes gene_type:complete
MINKKYIKLIRSRNRFNSNNFINNTVGKRIIDCIDLLKSDFKISLEIGVNDNLINDYLINKYPLESFERADLFDLNSKNKKIENYSQLNLDHIFFDNNKYDLIFSNNFLHLFDNFQDVLNKISRSLKSNGFFIATLPEINNIHQLVKSMYNTDQLIYNGVYQRFIKTFEVDYILSILKKLNFDIPTVIFDKVIVEYSDFNKLLTDCRATNLIYSNTDRKKNFENKKYFTYLENEYKKNYYKSGYYLELRFNIISAWKK